MKKRGWIAGLLLLALLTGCGAEEAATAPELTAELAYDAEQVAIVRSTPIAVTVYAPDKI